MADRRDMNPDENQDIQALQKNVFNKEYLISQPFILIYLYLCSIYENGFCDARPERYNIKFLFYVGLPVYCLVILGYAFARDPISRFWVFFLALMYKTIAFGILGIIGIVLVFNFNSQCFSHFYINVINFFIILILSLNSTLIVAFLGLMMVCCLPCLLCFVPGMIKDARRRKEI